jgi:hypothetical protein
MTQTTLMQPIIITCEAKRKQTGEQLDITILEAIDESLASFGDSVKQVVYHQLDKSYHVRKQDIPSKIDEFVSTVEEIFGFGARLIEMKILHTLYARTKGFAYFPAGEDLIFKDYVQSLRSFMNEFG